MEVKSTRLLCCNTCGLIQRSPVLSTGERAACGRCATVLRRFPTDTRNRALAFAFAALILYVPANLNPILVVEAFGINTVDYVWNGVESLWRANFESLAVLVLVTSLAIPLLKLLLLIAVFMAPRASVARRRLVRAFDVIADWWMVDVLLLAALVSLSRLSSVADARAGLGLYGLAGVMVLTIAATLSFDRSEIWEQRNAGR